MLSDQKQPLEQPDVHEVQLLANLDLDIEELEQRLELATAMHVDCWGNACGVNGCGANACAGNCC